MCALPIWGQMMDSMRGLLSGSHGQDDGGIDAPVAVGVDERRMQVRAYNHWASLLSDRASPSVEDLDLNNVGDFGPHSVLQIGRAQCRERVCPNVYISVVAVTIKKNK